MKVLQILVGYLQVNINICMNFKRFCLITEGEGFSLKEFIKEVPSDRNREFLKDRFNHGNSGSTLKDVEWNIDKDAIFLTFDVIPTNSKRAEAYDLKGNTELVDNYTVTIQLEDVAKWLKNRKDFFNQTKKNQVIDFKRFMNGTTLKVQSNDSSWQLQGTFETASDMGYSIEKYTGPKGRGVWSARHRGLTENPAYLTKHILESLKNLAFLPSKIVSKLRAKYDKSE